MLSIILISIRDSKDLNLVLTPNACGLSHATGRKRMGQKKREWAELKNRQKRRKEGKKAK